MVPFSRASDGDLQRLGERWGTCFPQAPTTPPPRPEAGAKDAEGNVCGNASPLFFRGASQVVPALALPTGVEQLQAGLSETGRFRGLWKVNGSRTENQRRSGPAGVPIGA